MNYAPTSSLLDQQKTSVNNLHYFCKTLVTCLLMCGKFSPAREEYKSSSDTELKRSASSELDCRSMSSSSTSLDPLFKQQVKGAEIMCISLSSVLKSSNHLENSLCRAPNVDKYQLRGSADGMASFTVDM